MLSLAQCSLVYFADIGETDKRLIQQLVLSSVKVSAAIFKKILENNLEKSAYGQIVFWHSALGQNGTSL